MMKLHVDLKHGYVELEGREAEGGTLTIYRKTPPDSDEQTISMRIYPEEMRELCNIFNLLS
jgi:hypothetical protein